MLRTTSTSPAPGRPKPGAPPRGAAAIGALGASWGRIVAVLRKEFVQLRRDRLTFAMLIGVPIMQLVLFGYAINGDPRQLPTALVALDDGPLVRAIVRAAENTTYFRIVAEVSEAQAERMVEAGQVQFAIVIPADFSRRLLRGDRLADAAALLQQDRRWMVVPFGTAVHVSAPRGADLPGWLAAHDSGGAWSVTPIATGLEDVFIALTANAQDNFS